MERGEIGMSTIDERIVQMKFENSNFQQGIKNSTDSLEKLKQSLNLDLAGKKLQDLNDTAKKFSLSSMVASFDEMINKAQILNTVIGVTLAGIAQKAIAAGTQMVKSLTIDPIKQGFDEYELKMGSIQTILANTSRYGTKLADVNKALDELNDYSDKTIYNFGEMTKNVALFTNAGIRLEDATSMIRGFSNAAAASGVTAANAAGAAYQLSQALSSGVVRLMDWKSLTNAGMGSANMRQGLIDISQAMGTFKGQNPDTVFNKFNQSLETGWLTADVMSKYLKIMAGDMTDAEMSALGLSDALIANFKKEQTTAENAATQVKTFTQLMGTMRESVASGWAETFQLVIGNFTEAQKLFTSINDVFGTIIKETSDARNAVLGGWKELGGRTTVIWSITNIFKTLGMVINTVSEAFKEIFPPTTSIELYDLTRSFYEFTRDLVHALRPALDDIKRTFRGLFAILGIVWEVVKAVSGAIGELFGEISNGSLGIFKFTGNIGDMIFNFYTALKQGEYLKQFFSSLVSVIKVPIIWIKDFVGALGAIVLGIGDLQSIISNGIGNAAESQASRIAAIGEVIAQTWTNVVNAFKSTMDMFKPVIDYIAAVFSMIGLAIKGGFEGAASSGTGDSGLKAILDIINTGLLGGIVAALFKFLKFFENGGPFQGFNDFFSELTNTLKTFQQQIKAKIILNIAIAVALIAASAIGLAMVDPVRLAGAVAAIALLFGQLLGAFALFGKIASNKDYAKVNLLGFAMILLSTALNILADAVVKLSKLSWEELLRGLSALSIVIGALLVITKKINNDIKGIIVAAFGLNLLAFAIKALIGPIKELAQLSFSELAKGVTALGVIIFLLIQFSKYAAENKKALGSAVAILALAAGINLIATAVERLGNMDLVTLIIGMTAMLVILGSIIAFARFSGEGKSLLQAAVGVLILAAAIRLFAFSIEALAAINLGVLVYGLIGMAVLITVIAKAMAKMPPNMIASATALLITAVALNILAAAVTKFGEMSLGEITKGLLIMAGSLSILAIALNTMVGTLPGSAALLVAALALNMLVLPLMLFGTMSLGAIGSSLLFLAGALGIIILAGIALKFALPGLIGFGVAVLLIGTGGYLAALGIFLLGVALGALVAAVAAGGATLVVFVQQVISLIPLIATKIAEGFVAFIKVIGESVPILMTALGQLIIGLLKMIRDVIPPLIETVMLFIGTLLKEIEANISVFVETGLRIIAGILDGLAKGAPDVAEKGTDLAIAVLKGMRDNYPRLMKEMAITMLTLIRALKETIQDYLPKIKKESEALGLAIVDGLTGGLGSKAIEFGENVQKMGADAIEGLKDILGIASPSKEFAKLGEYSGQGLINGLASTATTLYKQAQTVGTMAYDGLKSTISKMSNIVLDNINSDPTIRPVLDLSSIKKDASLIEGLIRPSDISVGTTYAQAASIALNNKVAAQQVASTQEAVSKTDTNITFVQNNNSPKALSAAEIYRQTKNQISAVKLTTAV